MYLCMYVRMCVYMYVCMYACMYSGIPLPLNNIVWQRVQGRGQIGGGVRVFLEFLTLVTVYAVPKPYSNY